MDLLSPEPGLVIWTGLTFLILIYLLGKFAWKPLLGAINEREATIKAAVENAAKATEELKQIEATKARIEAETRKERDSILKEAHALKDNIVEEAKNAAQQEATKIVEAAKAQIAKDRADAMQDLRKTVAKLSVEIASKVIAKDLEKDASQNDLVEKYLQECNFN
ncbi:MAG: F0F1 ATP synthase subunit B [Bacteroidales bacterium]|nr:F0F1 ATP synthase subunit B [Bacteroidales bacterium]MCQ2236141.1 F0F1 ATP synthase subunit B [Bacteroidales bacterium]